VGRIAPVSREMVLNFVAQFSLGRRSRTNDRRPRPVRSRPGVARIALDSPHNRNALSSALMTQLEQRLAEARAADDVRAVELTHNGGTFCAGADLNEARQGMEKSTHRVIALLRQIVELPKPVLASVDGHVRAGGLGLIGACDNRPGPARHRRSRSRKCDWAGPG